MSPSRLFFQPTTNLVWQRCRSAQNNSPCQEDFFASKVSSTLLEEGFGWGGGGGGGGGGMPTLF